MAGNKAMNNWVFYDNATGTDVGDAIFAIGNDVSTINLEFATNGTFLARVQGGIFDKNHFKPYPCFKLPTLELVSGPIIDGDYFYQIDTTALDFLKIELTQVTGVMLCRGKVVG